MLKLTAFVCLVLIGMLHAAKMSCDSCGPECSPSCGTRRYRACCFNYLRRKRGPNAEFWTSLPNQENSDAIPVFIMKLTPEDWSDHLASVSELRFNADKTQNRQTHV